LTWLRDCIVYQDFERRSDTIFRRTIPLMTGSFTPSVNADFEKDVYVADVREKGEKFFSSSPLAVSLFHPQRTTRSPLAPNDIKPDRLVSCPDCNSLFASENQWLKHCRATGHSFAAYRKQEKESIENTSNSLPSLDQTILKQEANPHPKPIDFTRVVPSSTAERQLDVQRTTKLFLLMLSHASWDNRPNAKRRSERRTLKRQRLGCCRTGSISSDRRCLRLA
jgi:hypothetical protein